MFEIQEIYKTIFVFIKPLKQNTYISIKGYQPMSSQYILELIFSNFTQSVLIDTLESLFHIEVRSLHQMSLQNLNVVFHLDQRLK